MTMYYLDSSVGSGKTRAFTQQVNNSKCNVLYVAPTLDLAKQTKINLESYGHHVHVAVSSAFDTFDVVPSVSMWIDEEIASSTLNKRKIIIISHAGFLSWLAYTDKSCLKQAKTFDLYVDEEMASVNEMLSFHASNMTSALDMSKFKGRFDYTLHHSEILAELTHGAGLVEDNKLILEGKLPSATSDEMDSSYDVNAFLSILKAVVYQSHRVYMALDYADTTMKCYKVLDFMYIDSLFGDVTLLSANFKNTPQYYCVKNTHNIDITPSPLTAGITVNTHDHGHMVEISYISDSEKINKSQLSDNKLCNHIFQAVAEHFDTPFLYSTHKSITPNKDGNVSWLDDAQGTMLPVKSHGINSYTDFTNVAALHSCGSDYTSARYIATLLGITSTEYRRITAIEPVYQLVGRTALRKHDFLTSTPVPTINVVVLTREIAESLQSIFTGSTIKGAIVSGKLRRTVSAAKTTARKFCNAQKNAFKKGLPISSKMAIKIKRTIKRHPDLGYKLADFGIGE